MTVTEQKLEGEFRYINSRLIANSEEVAFYNGNNREKLIVMASYQKLVSNVLVYLYFLMFAEFLQFKPNENNNSDVKTKRS